MTWHPAPIDPVPDPWPQWGLSLRTPRLSLLPDDDAGLLELVRLVHRGVHPAEAMPFQVAWSDADPRYVGRGMLQHFWSQRAVVSPELWSLHFLVWFDGCVAGVQSMTAERFGVLREVETGSYLGREYQGRGLGTEMRAAVLTFAFDVLGAVTARSAHLGDDGASARVSRRLGYSDDGTALVAPRGEPVTVRRLLLRPEDFVRPEWELDVTGYTPELAGLLAADPPA
ncbi:GNAT family N-acetyltransferase [Pseudonocardia endophytica]|uniref:RimJ/RimL family protein N-acetyltransferase n=1 Tax=Pseudonocardia endophytica TaxID=401976 RepID=A0A4R1I0F9_PSEEN|nr:GNAT family N-acetyltransferase [Pseudonocardia endophytica]TCK27341.1 RimJ/RimL family protein N-acetyltransferase [Pseudonocardia endophytica]